MAFNDKKFGPIFPTRFGVPNGKNTERAMLDRLGGSEGYRTQVRLNADGSTTTLRTRNGAPKFTTTRPEAQDEKASTAAYMESGQLELMSIAPEHPDRGKPSKWHLLDIAHGPDELYLGKIEVPPTDETSEPRRRQLGRQLNRPTLTEGMDSRAIGYPRSDDPVEDAKRKEAYKERIAQKSLASGTFPASLFSGKMRLFMQALYGAELTPEGSPLVVELVGSEVVLRYYGESGESVQLGLWGHNSPGVFSALDSLNRPIGKFWLIAIRNPTGAQFIATAYKLKFNATGKAIRKQYLKLVRRGAAAEVITKIEAYLFAHSTIDVGNPVVVGGFDGAPGDPLAYGWKFNSTGSKASMVSHELLGTGDQDLRWKARTTHVTFAHAFDSSTRLDVLAVSAQVTTHGEWTDGWGAYNIFVPLEDTSTDALVHFSLARDRLGVKPAFSFAEVPVYGFYKADVWVPVIMSRAVEEGPWPKYEQECSMPYPNPAVLDTVPNRYQYDVRLANQGFVYTSLYKAESNVMSLAFDGKTYSGVSVSGVHSKYVLEVGAGVWDTPGTTANFVSECIGSPVSFVPSDVYGLPPGFPVTVPLNFSAINFSQNLYEQTTETWAWTGWKFHSWTLVIPAYDCEAVFVGTHEYDAADGAVTHTRTSGASAAGQLKWSGQVFTPYSGYVSGWYGGTTEGLGVAVTVTDPNLPPTTTAEIYCSNTTISGLRGAYHASSTPLFQVDKNWPFYMAGMGASTSYGGRYALSEGLKSHISVVYPRGFVGWA